MTETRGLRVSVYGSFPRNAAYPARFTEKEFRAACRTLGQKLAKEGFRIVVCSSLEGNADRHVLEGALPVFLSKGISQTSPAVTWMRSAVGGPHNAYFEELSLRHPQVFTSRPIRAATTGNRPLQEELHLDSLEIADALIVIGGALATYTAGRAALVAQRPVVPISAFGGGAVAIANEMLPTSNDAQRDVIGRLTGPWSDQMGDAVIEQLRTLMTKPGWFETERWPKDIEAYKGHVDGIVLTMRVDEFNAVQTRFPCKVTISGRREYNFARVDSSNSGTFLIGTIKLPDQGTGEAQAATRDAIEDLDPGILLLVGIAGGAPGEVALGDVVFANRVYDLTVQAADGGGKRSFSLTGGPMHEAVRRRVANVHVSLQPYLEDLRLPTLPTLDYSAEVRGEKAHKVVTLLKERYGEPPVAPRYPVFFDGPIASSDTRVQDPELMELWRGMIRHTLAVEMELAGVYRGARSQRGEHLVTSIRGISDIVGLTRDPAWTAYAAEVAAAYTLAFVRSWDESPRRWTERPAAIAMR